MKYIVKLNQEPYISDDGKTYEAHGEITNFDKEHDADVLVYWDILDNYNQAEQEETDACDWSDPSHLWHYALGVIKKTDFEIND